MANLSPSSGGIMIILNELPSLSSKLKNKNKRKDRDHLEQDYTSGKETKISNREGLEVLKSPSIINRIRLLVQRHRIKFEA
jgi:hypothetical protein